MCESKGGGEGGGDEGRERERGQDGMVEARVGTEDDIFTLLLLFMSKGFLFSFVCFLLLFFLFL